MEQTPNALPASKTQPMRPSNTAAFQKGTSFSCITRYRATFALSHTCIRGLAHHTAPSEPRILRLPQLVLMNIKTLLRLDMA